MYSLSITFFRDDQFLFYKPTEERPDLIITDAPSVQMQDDEGVSINKAEQTVDLAMKLLPICNPEKLMLSLGAGTGPFTKACMASGVSSMYIENDPRQFKFMKDYFKVKIVYYL
jgi:hypothetical protein